MSDELRKKIIIEGEIGDVSGKLDEVGGKIDGLGGKLDSLNDTQGKASKTQATFKTSLDQSALSLLKSSGAIGILDKNTGGMATKMLTAVNSVKAFNVGLGAMKGALISTGIGALIVALGLLIAHWDDLTSMLSKTTKEQELLNKAIEESKDQMIDAYVTIGEVERALEDMHNGYLTGGEVLELYNEKLGDKLGYYDDINKLEDDFINKTGTYLKAIVLRKQADLLASQIAEKRSEMLNKKVGDDISAFTEFWIRLTTRRKDANLQYTIEAHKLHSERMALVQKEADELELHLKQILDSLNDLMKSSNIDDSSLKAEAKARKAREDANEKARRTAEENARKAKSAADKAAAERKAAADKAAADEIKRQEKETQDLKNHLDNVTKLNEEFYRDNLTDEEREIYDLDKKYEETLTTARGYLETDKEIIEQHNAGIALLDEEKFTKTQENIEQHNADIARLEEEKFTKLQEIQAKYTEKDREAKASAELSEIESYDAALEDELLTFEDKLARVADQERSITMATEIGEDERTELLRKNAEERKRILKENADAQQKIEETKQEALMRIAGEASAMMGSLSSLAGEHTAEGKALAIAGATIDMLATNINIIRGFSELGPWGIAAGIAAVAANTANMMATIKQITSVKVPNTTDKSAPTATATPTAMAAPTFNVVGQGANNQLAETIAGRQSEPVQAFVVSSEVTTAQALDRNRIDNSTFL